MNAPTLCPVNGCYWECDCRVKADAKEFIEAITELSEEDAEFFLDLNREVMREREEPC